MTTLHTSAVADDRAALAPYNFVPLPERVVPAEEGFAEMRGAQDRYHPGRFTGRIVCRLTTESPLFVRSGLTPEQLKDGLEAKDRPEFFFTASPDTPVIPGSSLRGMLRALVEIAAYGKIDRVSDRQRFFFRSFAQKDDPLKQFYDDRIGRFGRNVRVGYLEQEDGSWYVRPAKRAGGAFFVKVKEWDKKARRELIPRSLAFTRLNEPGYRPQYVPCSFTTRPGQRGVMIDQIGPPGSVRGGTEGWLITSGNMLETGDADAGGFSPRTSHVVVSKETEGVRLEIDTRAVEDYRAGLTDFQKERPFDPQWGALIVGRPIFYCEPGRDELVTTFGHSPNFRVPYRFPSSERAASPHDFVPRDMLDESMVDLAEAIFGFVRRSRQRTQIEQAVAGRVFVSDATPVTVQANLWESEQPFTPHILASPKLTTFQHYLVQPLAKMQELRHYGSQPDEQTTIRGHKLYWHKGARPALAMSPEKLKTASKTQLTTMRPVRPGVSFTFTLHVENLSQVELGALLWVLRVGGDSAYRLKLGMGKPLGMGAVRIEHELRASQRPERYARLFDGVGWAAAEAELPADMADEAVREFEGYVLEQSGERERGYTALRDTLRMRCLLALLSWPGPLPEKTRYLEIERPVVAGFIRAASTVDQSDPSVNEYRNRPVLPLPTQVAGLPLNDVDIEAFKASGPRWKERAEQRRQEEERRRQEDERRRQEEKQRQSAVLEESLKRLDIGVELTGNRRGEVSTPVGRGVRVELNLKGFAVPKGKVLIGLIPRKDAAGGVSGGFRGTLADVEVEKGTIYLILKPGGTKPKEG